MHKYAETAITLKVLNSPIVSKKTVSVCKVYVLNFNFLGWSLAWNGQIIKGKSIFRVVMTECWLPSEEQ